MHKALFSIVSVILLMVGALFYAPTVSADDSDIYEDILEHFDLDSSTYSFYGYIDSSWITFNGNIKSGRLYFVSDRSLQFFNVSLTENGCSFRIRDLYTYENYTRINDISHRDGDETFIYNHLDSNGVSFNSPFSWNGNTSSYTSINANYIDSENAGIPSNISQFITYNEIVTFVNKPTFPIYKTLYSQYMLDRGLSIDSAFLADNNFNVVLEIPIVTSYNELDSDYSGFYCLSTVNTYTFKFDLARTPGYIPSTEWFDTYLIIGFTLPSNTECTVYFGTVSDFFHPFCYKRDDSSYYLTLDNFQNEKRFAVSDTVISGFFVSASPPGDPAHGAYTGIKWRVQSPAVEIAPLYLSFTYALEDNGTVTEGEGSDDYDGFKNTFINNVTFSSYQSVSVSVPNYDGSYDITYDSNFVYLMDKIFNVDFINEMVVGVLAISMACYIIFGKML